MAHNTELGRLGESIAERHLEAIGMHVIARNWRCHHGEVDLIAVDGRTTVIVEVKTRSGERYGHPFEAITPVKLGRLRRLASAWCAHADGPASRIGRVRIDAIAVHIRPDATAEVEHLEGLD